MLTGWGRAYCPSCNCISSCKITLYPGVPWVLHNQGVTWASLSLGNWDWRSLCRGQLGKPKKTTPSRWEWGIFPPRAQAAHPTAMGQQQKELDIIALWVPSSPKQGRAQRSQRGEWQRCLKNVFQLLSLNCKPRPSCLRSQTFLKRHFWDLIGPAYRCRPFKKKRREGDKKRRPPLGSPLFHSDFNH